MSPQPVPVADFDNPFPDDPEFDADPTPVNVAFLPRVIPIAEVPSARQEWLWPGYIPAGTLTVLDGDPGAGKSLLLIDLAARVSKDGLMPDGAKGPHGHVILITGNPLANSVRPRLEAAGADLNSVSIIRTVQNEDGQDEPFVLPRDLQHLRDIVIRHHAQLLIFDPLPSFLKGEVTQTLRKLALLAEETGCAILLSRHLAKGKCREPLYRGAGPLAIIAAVQAALLLARDPELPKRRVLAPYKNSLGELAEAITFTMANSAEPPKGGTTNIVWGDNSEWTAEQLLAPMLAEREQSLLNDACRLLEQATYFQPRDAAHLRKEAHQLGISDMTLRRAKAALGLRSKRQGFGSKGTWYWYRPDDPQFGAFFENGTVEAGDLLQYRDRKPGDPLKNAASAEARANYTNNHANRRQEMLDEVEVNARLRRDVSQGEGPALDLKGVHEDEQECENPEESADPSAGGDAEAKIKEIKELLAEVMIAKGVSPNEPEWTNAEKSGPKQTRFGCPARKLRSKR